MLNPLPELLFLAPLAATLIRATAAATFMLAGLAHVRTHERTWQLYAVLTFEFLIGLSLAFGFYTQIGALAGAVVALVWLLVGSLRPMPKSTVVLLLVLCLSLIVTGAGPLSFDLPL